MAVCLLGVALTGPCSEMCRRRNEGRKKLMTKARYSKIGLAAAVRVYLYQIFYCLGGVRSNAPTWQWWWW